jgi:hypothetical protein
MVPRLLVVLFLEIVSQIVFAQKKGAESTHYPDTIPLRNFGAQLKVSLTPQPGYYTITQFPSLIIDKRNGNVHQFSVMIFSASGKRNDQLSQRIYRGGVTFLPEYQFVRRILKRKTFLSPQVGVTFRPNGSAVRYYDINRNHEIRDVSIGMAVGVSPQVQINFNDRFFGIFSPQLDFFQYTYGKTKIMDDDVPPSQQVLYHDWEGEFFFEVDRIVWQVGIGVWSGKRTPSRQMQRGNCAKNFGLKASFDYETVRENGEYQVSGVKPSISTIGKRNSHELEINRFHERSYYSYEFRGGSPTDHRDFHLGLRYQFSRSIFIDSKTVVPMVGVSLSSVFTSEKTKSANPSFTEKYRYVTETLSIVPQLRFSPGEHFFFDISAPINLLGFEYEVQKRDNYVLNKTHSFKQEAGYVGLRAGLGLKL